MDIINNKPDITELYVKHKELTMLLKRYENLNKEYIDIIYKNQGSKEDIDQLNREINIVNEKLIKLSNELQELNIKLNPENIEHQKALKVIETKIESLMPMLINTKNEFEKTDNEFTDIIGQEKNSKIVEESSNLKYIVLLFFTIILIVILSTSLITPYQTKAELFIFLLIVLVIVYQIIYRFLK